MNRRTPLTLALSLDQDRTWPVRRDLREGDNDYGYPIAFQAADGRIHVIYTSDRRTVVNHAVFDEDWVIHGSVDGDRTGKGAVRHSGPSATHAPYFLAPLIE